MSPREQGRVAVPALFWFFYFLKKQKKREVEETRSRPRQCGGTSSFVSTSVVRKLRVTNLALLEPLLDMHLPCPRHILQESSWQQLTRPVASKLGTSRVATKRLSGGCTEVSIKRIDGGTLARDSPGQIAANATAQNPHQKPLGGKSTAGSRQS